MGMTIAVYRINSESGERTTVRDRYDVRRGRVQRFPPRSRSGSRPPEAGQSRGRTPKVSIQGDAV
jgi:hypothetical protein